MLETSVTPAGTGSLEFFIKGLRAYERRFCADDTHITREYGSVRLAEQSSVSEVCAPDSAIGRIQTVDRCV